MSESMPDISSMKLGEIKKELNLYGIDSGVFVEKNEFVEALDNARKTMPRPTTTYHEVEVEEPQRERSGSVSRNKSSKSSSSSSSRKSSSSHGSRRSNSGSTSSSSFHQPAPAPSPIPTPSAPPAVNMKKLAAMRSAVVALQQIKEHPSERLVGERNHSFLPGAPFSFSLKGSIFESDAAILRVPDGVCLTVNSASIDRKEMTSFLTQKGSIGVSLKVATEDNPQLLPIWTFDRDKSRSYTVTDLGLEICGPRTMRLLAFMEMGFSSKASVDLHVFGGVKLDMDKF